MSGPDLYDDLWANALEVASSLGVRDVPRWIQQSPNNSLHSRKQAARKNKQPRKMAEATLELLSREIDAARADRRPSKHNRVLYEFVALLQAASTTLPATRRSAQSMARGLVRGVDGTPAWLRNYVQHAPATPAAWAVERLTGYTLDGWLGFCEEVAAETARRKTPLASEFKDAPAVNLDAGMSLSRLARDAAKIHTEVPEYDRSDSELKISSVSVSGFRGSPSEASLDLTRATRPLDALIWGDNGTGKSTLVDGIEFALQQRVDRSSDFNSSLRPKVRNLSSKEAYASVTLSDGSAAKRSLARGGKDGREHASSNKVRPGFRIAPVVIRRSDILRFLDTDALSRGTVFFDYFPDPSGAMALRPDAEMAQIREENFLVRVARKELANRLAKSLPEADVDFNNMPDLAKFLAQQAPVGVDAWSNEALSAFGDEVRSDLRELKAAHNRYKATTKKLNAGVNVLNPRAYASQLARLRPALQAVNSHLTADFKRITNVQHVQAIQVLVAQTGPVSLDVVVDFTDGTAALPQQVFSEGYQDLIALLFFLAVTKEAAASGQARVLVLDDVLQSVDSSIRVATMNYILDEFKDWQLIVTGHDRAWLAQLRGLFHRHGRAFVESYISDWSFDGGIRISGGSRSRAQALREALDRSDERSVASTVGPVLEEISGELSWRLNIRVTRRQGDRYTLGDLWPGVARELKRTTLRDTVQAIDMRLDIRNLLGAHYNEWADQITWTEIKDFGQSALQLYDATHCPNCAGWVSKSGGRLACKCGTTMVAS